MPYSNNMIDNIDTYANMVMRRGVNEFAQEPLDFNLEGIKKALEYTTLSSTDTLLDIGCSNAEFVLRAASAMLIKAFIIGLDPDQEPYNMYRPNTLDTSNFSFIQGFGENIPLADNSVNVTTAHNVLFRSFDMKRMLEEMKRVTIPGGLIMISTNARDHAYWRHYIETKTAELTSKQTGVPIMPVKSPAAGCYLEDLPDIISSCVGLEIIDDTVIQDTEAIITAGERYEVYRLAIHLTVPADDEIPPMILKDRRSIADSLLEYIVLSQIEQKDILNKKLGINKEAYFSDRVHRGLIVCRKK
jgi:ubiquinone/menaquinone biosynthesis C-methylase UbiE